MKKIILVFGFTIVSSFAFSQADAKKAEQKTEPKFTGKVSHFYKGTCGTVIILNVSPELVLIPKKKLAKSFDKEGMELKFDYKLLRMPNPRGCEKGNMAEITNVSKK